MRYTKALGFSLLAALSVLAFTAVAANAGEVKGDVKLNGALLVAQATVGGELALPAHSSLLVPNLNFAIRCNTASIANGSINPLLNGVTRGTGTIAFKECSAFEHKVPVGGDQLLGLPALTKCLIEGTLGAAKHEIVAKTKIQIVRNKAQSTGGVPYVLVAPETGTVFTNILFGPLCGALAEECIEVTGSLVGEALELEAVKLPIKEAPEAIQLLFGDKLMFGTQQAFLDGEVKLLYTGGSAGEKIGVEAGNP